MTVELTPIRIYPDFATQWDTFADDLRTELRDTLRALQQNPHDPEILLHAQEKKGRYALPLRAGYVMYWKLVREDSQIIPLKDPVIRIDLLAIQKV